MPLWLVLLDLDVLLGNPARLIRNASARDVGSAGSLWRDKVTRREAPGGEARNPFASNRPRGQQQTLV